jgi:hypothetical protein
LCRAFDTCITCWCLAWAPHVQSHIIQQIFPRLFARLYLGMSIEALTPKGPCCLQAHGMYPAYSEAAAYGDPAAYLAYSAGYPEPVGYPEPSTNYGHPDSYAATQYPAVSDPPYRRNARAPAHPPPPVEPPAEKPKLEPPTVNVKVCLSASGSEKTCAPVSVWLCVGVGMGACTHMSVGVGVC